MEQFTEEDREATIAALRDRLSQKEIRSLLPEDLEPLVARVENQTLLLKKRLKDEELPTLLVDLHGPELLRARRVREVLLRNASLDQLKELLASDPAATPPGRTAAEGWAARKHWHAGKRWARLFVSTLGLPGALAGSPDGGSAPDFEDVEPFVPLPDLHDFQVDLRDELLQVIVDSPGRNRAILSLPTGAGKTRTAVEAIAGLLGRNELRGSYVLWIAQGEELCEQAVQAFREVWLDLSARIAAEKSNRRLGTLRLFRLWSSRNPPDPAEGGVIVGSIQKLQSLTTSKRDEVADLLAEIGLVVVDEAHHAIAPEYTQVFAALGLGSRQRESVTPMIGLTATPYRGSDREKEQLVNRFYGRLLTPSWKDPIRRLRERRILSNMIVRRFDTGVSFQLTVQEAAHVQKFHELPKNALNRIGSDPERNKRLLRELLKFPEGKPVLVFGCSVNHSQALALLLRRVGRTAAVITSETPRALRRRWINAFRVKEIQFLCNYGVLTTGFDAPQIEAVVIARPTGSVLLYEQMVGRGMRGLENGGTEECEVVDVVDVIQQFGDQMSYDRYAQLWNRKGRTDGGPAAG